jgi:hypothetical protein
MKLTYVKKKATLALAVALLSFSEYPRAGVKLSKTAISIIEMARPKDPHIMGYTVISLDLQGSAGKKKTYTSTSHPVEEECGNQ